MGEEPGLNSLFRTLRGRASKRYPAFYRSHRRSSRHSSREAAHARLMEARESRRRRLCRRRHTSTSGSCHSINSSRRRTTLAKHITANRPECLQGSKGPAPDNTEGRAA